jgi:hypothetical protein
MLTTLKCMEVRQFGPNREPVNNEFASLQVSELSSLVELSTLLAQACRVGYWDCAIWILGRGFSFSYITYQNVPPCMHDSSGALWPCVLLMATLIMLLTLFTHREVGGAWIPCTALYAMKNVNM